MAKVFVQERKPGQRSLTGHADQRLAKYMVTSKPIRKSVNVGFFHMGLSSCRFLVMPSWSGTAIRA